MKKFILFCLLGLSMLGLSAQNPDIPLLQAFDGRYNNEHGVKITEVTQPSNYYYGIDVKDNPSVIAQLKEWFDQTSKKAVNVNKNISEGKIMIVLNFIGDKPINVGAHYPQDLSAIKIFLQSNQSFD